MYTHDNVGNILQTMPHDMDQIVALYRIEDF